MSNSRFTYVVLALTPQIREIEYKDSKRHLIFDLDARPVQDSSPAASTSLYGKRCSHEARSFGYIGIYKGYGRGEGAGWWQILFHTLSTYKPIPSFLTESSV